MGDRVVLVDIQRGLTATCSVGLLMQHRGRFNFDGGSASVMVGEKAEDVLLEEPEEGGFF